MALIDLQRDVQRVCLEHDPPAEALSRLGDQHIWLVYREMVRRRLYGELRHAFRRTYADAGDGLFAAAFDRYMAEDPPRQRRFFAVPAGFAATAIACFQQAVEDNAAPPHLPDLARFEAARWEVSDLDDRVDMPDGLRELSFDDRPVLSRALRVLELRHAVHDKPGEEGYRRGRFHVALHRSADDQPVRWWKLDPTMFALIQQIQANPDSSLTEAVQAVSQKLQRVVDQPFLEALCSVLSDFVERRILLGSH